jgi:hypothetical protein
LKPSGPPLWLTGALVAALIGTMVYVTDKFMEYDKLQRCVTSGHRDCGPPIDPTKLGSP